MRGKRRLTASHCGEWRYWWQGWKTTRPARRLLDEGAVGEGRRADVAEVQRLRFQYVLGAGADARGGEEGAGGLAVGGRQVGHRDDLDLAPQVRVLRPLRRVAVERDVPGAEERTPQRQCHPPSRPTRVKTSSRIPRDVSASSRAMERAGLMRKWGL